MASAAGTGGDPPTSGTVDQAPVRDAPENVIDYMVLVERVSAERDRLREAYQRATLELELLKRRIFVAKAERVDTAQLELEFGQKLAQLEQLAGTLGMPAGEPEDATTRDSGADGDGPASGGKRRGHSQGGRRDVTKLGLQEQRLELRDPLMEALVEKGEATYAGFEESARLTWHRKGMGVLVIARAKYRVSNRGVTETEVTEMAPEAIPRCLATPALLAHVLTAKHCDGLPLHRLEGILERDGCGLDRGTMCRWTEDLGGSFGATIVEAMLVDARNAFCLATDATGLRIIPERAGPDAPRQACRRGQMFVLIADRQHVLFVYKPRGTSEAVKELVGDYSGYVQADAGSIFNVLFTKTVAEGGREEVGCWSHLRRKYWESASNKCPVAREGLKRISRIFELDGSWQGLPPKEIKSRRQTLLKPHVTAFMEWAAAEFAKVEHQRGELRSALGYAVRNRAALTRFLDDGRLQMTNNHSERELRAVAVGRKAWLFSGSDGHAESAAAIMTLVASARLHGLDPELYLRDIIRVFPHWDGAPWLALAPAYWAETRKLLDLAQLAEEYGPLDVPADFPHLPRKPEEQRAAD
jgi:transposase